MPGPPRIGRRDPSRLDCSTAPFLRWTLAPLFTPHPLCRVVPCFVGVLLPDFVRLVASLRRSEPSENVIDCIRTPAPGPCQPLAR